MLVTTAVTPLLVLEGELTLLNRAPDRSGSVSLAVRTYFILRYARYAIKYDYLNLIFELCLRFFILQAT